MTIIYRNARGGEVIIGARRPFWLDQHNGLADAEAEIATYTTSFDGVGVSNVRLLERPIDLMGYITEESMLSTFLTVCNPKTEGELIVGSRSIRCNIKSVSCPRQPSDIMRKFTLSLLAPYPYFSSIDEITQEIISWSPAWTFPFTLPETSTFIFGSRDQSGHVEVTNDGQVACPVTITMRFLGLVTNPWVKIIETGEELRFGANLKDGDVIEIDTYPWRKQVRLNGVPNYNIIDKKSVFFWLPQGKSTVGYGADTGAMSMEVKLSYRAYYLGGIA